MNCWLMANRSISYPRLTMKIIFKLVFSFCSFLFSENIFAQPDSSQGKFDTAAQSKPADVIEVAIKLFKIDTTRNPRSTKKVNFSLLPGASAVPGGGAAIVTTLNAAFYLGDRKQTNLSTVYFTPVFTTSGKILLTLKSSIWLKNNSLFIPGEIRLFKYPYYTWGLGGNTPEENRTVLNFNYTRVYQSILKKIVGPLSAGIGYRFDGYYDIEEEVEDTSRHSNITTYTYGADSSTSSGFTLEVLYDSRKNSINPPNGKYLSVVYRNNPAGLGSHYEWQSLFVDGRIYLPIKSSKRKLIAFRSYYWTRLDGHMPYLDLPSNGWDFAGLPRGIQRSRYRSNALLSAETDYRFDISANGFWGGVVFASCLSASEFNTQNFSVFHPAAGCGIRIKFNKYSGSNIAIDFAFSKHFAGVYLNLGEAF